MWPVHDPKQAREFRNICFKWLEVLKKSNVIPPTVPIRRSYLEECKGERLALIFSFPSFFSSFVFQTDRYLFVCLFVCFFFLFPSRFEQLMLALSNHVISVVLSRFHSSRSLEGAAILSFSFFLIFHLTFLFLQLIWPWIKPSPRQKPPRRTCTFTF